MRLGLWNVLNDNCCVSIAQQAAQTSATGLVSFYIAALCVTLGRPSWVRSISWHLLYLLTFTGSRDGSMGLWEVTEEVLSQTVRAQSEEAVPSYAHISYRALKDIPKEYTNPYNCKVRALAFNNNHRVSFIPVQNGTSAILFVPFICEGGPVCAGISTHRMSCLELLRQVTVVFRNWVLCPWMVIFTSGKLKTTCAR